LEAREKKKRRKKEPAGFPAVGVKRRLRQEQRTLRKEKTNHGEQLIGAPGWGKDTVVLCGATSKRSFLPQVKETLGFCKREREGEH